MKDPKNGRRGNDGLKKERLLQGLEVLETQNKNTLRLLIIVCLMYQIKYLDNIVLYRL